MPVALLNLLSLCALPRARALLLPPGCKSRQNRLGRLRSEIRIASTLFVRMFPVVDIVIDPQKKENKKNAPLRKGDKGGFVYLQL